MMLLGADGASGQSYPGKPVRMLTAELGGGSDIAARLIAQWLSGSLGQQVVVDNRVGGIILLDTAAKAPPDGYTLVLYSSALWLMPFMRDRLPYDPIKDFSPIVLVGSTPMVLVVHPSLPVNSVKDLVVLAKGKPGELNYSTGPAGATPHLAGELFKSMAGVDIVHVPYKGVALALNDVIGGRVQMMFPNVGAVTQHIRSGRVKALAITSAGPSALLPGLPTVAGSGLPGYESVGLMAIFAPAGTPAAILRRLNHEMARVLETADLKEKFFNAGTEVIGGSPETLAATMKSEMARIGKVIRNAGIRIE
jgi:tripartite-type tricarboxylate transporter receptor subunit TctC